MQFARVVSFQIAMENYKLSLFLTLGAVIFYTTKGVQSHKECGMLNDANDEHSLTWTVNVYRKNEAGNHEFICLGTVISRKIILTAAHCFYDDVNKKIKTGPYLIATGQKYKAWSNDNSNNIQMREITGDNIIIPPKYTGFQNMYSNNIAIVKLNSEHKLNINDATKRVCVYWDNDFVEPVYQQDQIELKVVIWGEGVNASLEVLKPSFINLDVCIDTVPENFRPFLTFDKMCAQVQELHNIQCTGSGLYALNKNDNRWYLIGIASEIKFIDKKTIITFTKIQLHLNWLSNTAFLHLR